MRIFRKILWWLVGGVVLCLALLFGCDFAVSNYSKEKTTSDIDQVKPVEYGLLLGTTPHTRYTRLKNYFFVYRINAAEDLYKSGKVKKILISGDQNSLDGINEVECMRDSLVAHGVNVADIVLDGEGYSTIESVENAIEKYHINTFIVISQRFQNERAIYLADHLGIEAHDITGFNAADPTSKQAAKTYAREYLARVKVFKDLITHRKSN